MKLFPRLVLSLLFTLVVPALSQAQESLDPAFGENGQLTTGFSIYDDRAFAVTVQADGKILVAGESENGVDTDIALVRYHANGTLDSDFNSTGQVTVAVGSGDDRGLALAVQEDGKILVAGTTDNGNDLDIAIIRLTADGLPDMGFDQDGQVSISLPNSNDKAQSVLLQTDGKIILAGSSEEGERTQLFVARLTRDGVLDTGFGNNGLVTGPGKYDSATYSAALQEDGRILLAGFSRKEDQQQAALFSFLSNGQVDQNFGEQGIALAGTGSESSIFYDVAFLEGGKILAAGAIQGEAYRSILLAGFSQNGTADQQFNGQGMVRTDLGTDSVAYALAIAKDGSIYLAGSGSKGQDTDFILLHYSATGQAAGNTGETVEEEEEEEDSFASGTITLTPLIVQGSLYPENVVSVQNPNYTLTDFDQYNDVARALFIQEDGTIILVGTTENGTDVDFGLLRLSTVPPVQGRTENGIATPEGFYIATTPPMLITRNSAASGGYVTAPNRESTISERGVCFGITHAPGLKDFSLTDNDNDTGGETLQPFQVETVREGCTSDGSGQGEFRSDILNITPNTLYFVRSYAKVRFPLVSADDVADNDDSTEFIEMIIYGNEIAFETKDDPCFIATAAYGSPDDSHVLILRQFRDTYLKSSSLGRKLVTTYYTISPPLAQLISGSPTAQRAISLAITPVTGISFLILNPVFTAQLFCLLFLCLGLLQFISGRQKRSAHEETT